MLHRSRLADDGRAARLAPRTVAQLAGGDPGDQRGRDGGPARGVHLARFAQALGDREHGGQRDLDLLPAVVVLELEAQGGAVVLERAHPAGEREVEERRHLGPHLPGLPVNGVAAEQDEIEGTRGAQRGRQGPRRGERVGAGEGRVADVQARGRPPGDRLAQDVLGPGGPEGDHGARPPGGPGQRDPLGHGAAAVRVHLDVDAPAHQPSLLEAERRRDRDLLGQRRDPQRLPGGTPHRAALTRSGHR